MTHVQIHLEVTSGPQSPHEVHTPSRLEEPGRPPGLFPFWDLPPELRDAIYDHLVASYNDLQTNNRDDSAMTVWLRDAPCLSGLLLSRQFRQEYLDRVRGRTTVIFHDNERGRVVAPNISPSIIKNFVCVEMTLACLISGSQVDDLNDHVIWTHKVLFEFPLLLSVRIRVNLEWEESGEFVWPDSPYGSQLRDSLVCLSRMPGVESLEVRRCVLGDNEVLVDVGRYVCWSKKGSWISGEREVGEREVGERGAGERKAVEAAIQGQDEAVP